MKKSLLRIFVFSAFVLSYVTAWAQPTAAVASPSSLNPGETVEITVDYTAQTTETFLDLKFKDPDGNDIVVGGGQISLDANSTSKTVSYTFDASATPGDYAATAFIVPAEGNKYNKRFGSSDPNKGREKATVTVVGNATSINDEVAWSSKVFPNPASEVLNIEAPVGSQVEIFDVTGGVVYQAVQESAQKTISTSDFTAGVYIVKIVNEGKSVTEKLQVL